MTDDSNDPILEVERQPAPPLDEILREIERFVRRFVVLDDIQFAAATLWTAHTWVMDAAHSTPYMHVTSAEEESGKTRLLEVLQLLVKTPILATDITEAALFRVIDKLEPTLFLDEVDAVFSRAKSRDGSKDTFRSLLNAGYRRGGRAYRIGNSNGSQTLDPFDVFGPKALAGIGHLPRTLASRCIRIEMQRRSVDEEVEDFYPEDLEEETSEIKAHIEAWASEETANLKRSRPSKIPGLRDRVNEVWRPLLAIATAGENGWDERALHAAKELAKVGVEASWGVMLLTDIRTILVGKDIERISSAEMIDFLKIIEESPWAEEFDSKGAPRKLARLLKPYGIAPGNVRMEDGSVPKGYKREQFWNAWKRLLPAPVSRSATSSLSATPLSQTQADVADIADVAAPDPVGWDG